MIMECADCRFCADFADDFRIFCMYPELPADEVCEYQSLGTYDAIECTHFLEDWAQQFTWEDLLKAEGHSQQVDLEGLVTYEGIRDWLDKRSPFLADIRADVGVCL